MELWIRSQKSEKLRPMLLKANEFEIGDYDENMNCIVVNNLYCVGVYKTKERALEVLDEIQKRMMINETLIGDYEQQDIAIKGLFLKYNSMIYEMPKE